MPYAANVLRVMIASPSDITDARDAVEAAIYGWNTANAESQQVVLQPWRWESASVPLVGDHPQSLINAQGVDNSDVVFGLFGSRLGSSTPGAVSGTVEEIERAVAQGKPVHLYFSTAPRPNNVDPQQLQALQDFRAQIQQRGLLGEFGDVSELRDQVWRAIQFDIAGLELGVPAPSRPTTGVQFQVQPQQEREISGHDNKGRPRYRTRHWIDVTNTSNEDAQEVLFEAAGENSSMVVASGSTPTIVPAGQTRRVNVAFTFGGGPGILRIRWRENGEAQQQEFQVS